SITGTSFVPEPTNALETPSQPNLVRIQKLELELAQGNAAGTSWFDNIVVTSFAEGEVLDTLLAMRGGAVSEGVAPTMTLYHGHDFSRPFIYTGFAPWMFRQSQC